MDENEIRGSDENKIEIVMDGVGHKNKIGLEMGTGLRYNDQPPCITQDFLSFKTERYPYPRKSFILGNLGQLVTLH